jgi:hypothetical protein
MFIKLLLGILFVIHSNAANAGPNRCFDIFSKESLAVVTGEPVWRVEEDQLGFTIPHSDFYINTYLNGEGSLFLSMRLVDFESKTRSHLDGKIVYDKVIEHYGQQNIYKIVGNWVEGTNYEKYFKSIAEGKTPQQAAAMTWSGVQAARHGFSVVSSLWVLDNPVGPPTVWVEFSRPTPAP